MQSFATLRNLPICHGYLRRTKNAIPVMNVWPIQAVFWLEWGSSILDVSHFGSLSNR